MYTNPPTHPPTPPPPHTHTHTPPPCTTPVHTPPTIAARYPRPRTPCAWSCTASASPTTAPARAGRWPHRGLTTMRWDLAPGGAPAPRDTLPRHAVHVFQAGPASMQTAATSRRAHVSCLASYSRWRLMTARPPFLPHPQVAYLPLAHIPSMIQLLVRPTRARTSRRRRWRFSSNAPPARAPRWAAAAAAWPAGWPAPALLAPALTMLGTPPCQPCALLSTRAPRRFPKRASRPCGQQRRFKAAPGAPTASGGSPAVTPVLAVYSAADGSSLL